MATVSLQDDGNLKIEVGEPHDITTQLGKKESSFEPYKISTRYSGINAYYCYVIKGDYIPSNFSDADEFVETLRIQAPTNEFIKNYSEIGAEYLNDYLKDVGLIDNSVYFVKIPTDLDQLNDMFFDQFIGMSNNFINDGISLNKEFDVETLKISSNAPKEAKEYFEDIFKNLNKVDAYYSFDELKIDPKHYIHLNGFVKINWKKFNSIKSGSEIILVRDRLKNGHIVYDCIDQLSSKFNVIAVVNLFRQL